MKSLGLQLLFLGNNNLEILIIKFYFHKINKPVFTFVLMTWKKEGENGKFSHCNFFPKNRRGQFFIIAAVIIIVVIVSVVTISNYTQKKETTKLYDLGQELGIESQNVLDYGTYSAKSPDEMEVLMQNFVQNYRSYMEQNKNIYFIFGNTQKIYTIGYQDASPGELACISLNPGCCNQGQSCVNGACQKGNGKCKSNQVQCGTSNCCNRGETCSVDGKCKTGGICRQGTQCSPCTQIEISEGEQALASQVSNPNGAVINKVSVTIGENVYQFNLKNGENFYFVIWQQIGGEKHVVTSNT